MQHANKPARRQGDNVAGPYRAGRKPIAAGDSRFAKCIFLAFPKSPDGQEMPLAGAHQRPREFSRRRPHDDSRAKIVVGLIKQAHPRHFRLN
jgi:hypothetical protein